MAPRHAISDAVRSIARLGRFALVFLLLFFCVNSPAVRAYSVLSHQAIIDASWEDSIKPDLLQRFPKATPEELSAAQAYAYGGAIIQDLGYYPYGSHFFSDLTHYVRSGDFILALLHDANDIYEYAFALGALAHYAADNYGHRIGTNRAVPVLYPKLRRKYGDFVTYEEDKLAHVKTEFGFDVLEVAKGRYAPDSYHDFIGFEVSQRLLEQAFVETYGIELKSVLVNEERSLSSYRHAVSKLFPKATRIAWHLKKDEIMGDVPGITRRKFLYNLKRSNFEKEWGKDYKRPSPGEKFLAFLYLLLPKWGPLRVLQFRTPTPETERYFEASFNETLDHYRMLLHDQRENTLKLPNDNFDVGADTGPGKYKLNDGAHAELLTRLADNKFSAVSPALMAEMQQFYADPAAATSGKMNKKMHAKLQSAIDQLKQLKPAEAVAAGN